MPPKRQLTELDKIYKYVSDYYSAINVQIRTRDIERKAIDDLERKGLKIKAQFNDELDKGFENVDLIKIKKISDKLKLLLDATQDVYDKMIKLDRTEVSNKILEVQYLFDEYKRANPGETGGLQTHIIKTIKALKEILILDKDTTKSLDEVLEKYTKLEHQIDNFKDKEYYELNAEKKLKEEEYIEKRKNRPYFREKTKKELDEKEKEKQLALKHEKEKKAFKKINLLNFTKVDPKDYNPNENYEKTLDMEKLLKYYKDFEKDNKEAEKAMKENKTNEFKEKRNVAKKLDTETKQGIKNPFYGFGKKLSNDITLLMGSNKASSECDCEGGKKKMARRQRLGGKAEHSKVIIMGNPWLLHLKRFQATHKNLSYGECMQEAAKTYTKNPVKNN